MRLKAIAFSIDEEALWVAAQLCTDIGARLEYASFNILELSAYIFQTISEGCPNVRMKDVVAMGENARDVFEAIGPKTFSACVADEALLIAIDDALIRVATERNILQEFTLRLSGDQMRPFLQGFPSTPKPLLKKVILVFVDYC